MPKDIIEQLKQSVRKGDIIHIKALDHHMSLDERPKIDDIGVWNFEQGVCILEVIGKIIKITKHEVYIMTSCTYGAGTERANVHYVLKCAIQYAKRVKDGKDFKEEIKSIGNIDLGMQSSIGE